MKNTILMCLVMVLLMAFESQAATHHHNIHHSSVHKVAKVETDEMCLAKNIYYEAGAEPYEGKLAVAQVTMNRVEHPSFPKTVCGVVHQRNSRACQFSWNCSPIKAINEDSENWQQSLKIAKLFLTEDLSYVKFTDSVLFFHEKHLPFNWKEKYIKVATIGNHIFYRTHQT